MPSVEEIKVYLAATVAETERTATAMRGIADRLDEALARLRLTATGTAHPALAEAVNRLEQAKVRLDEALLLAHGAVESANTYRATI